jgi:hypothetical protein
MKTLRHERLTVIPPTSLNLSNKALHPDSHRLPA